MKEKLSELATRIHDLIGKVGAGQIGIPSLDLELADIENALKNLAAEPEPQPVSIPDDTIVIPSLTVPLDVLKPKPRKRNVR